MSKSFEGEGYGERADGKEGGKIGTCPPFLPRRIDGDALPADQILNADLLQIAKIDIRAETTPSSSFVPPRTLIPWMYAPAFI